jgi:hypothetical protein
MANSALQGQKHNETDRAYAPKKVKKKTELKKIFNIKAEY